MGSRVKIKADWRITLEINNGNVANHEFNFEVKIPGLEELRKIQSLHIFLPKDEWSKPTAYVDNLEEKDCIKYDSLGPSFEINLRKMENYFTNTDTVNVKVKTIQKICTPPIGDKYFYYLNIKPSANYRDWHILIKLPQPYGKIRSGILRIASNIKQRNWSGEIYSIDAMLLTPGVSISPYHRDYKEGKVEYKFDGALNEGCGIIYSVMNFSNFWSLLTGLGLGFVGAVILEVISNLIGGWIYIMIKTFYGVKNE